MLADNLPAWCRPRWNSARFDGAATSLYDWGPIDYRIYLP